jgi:hypothetical protein
MTGSTTIAAAASLEELQELVHRILCDHDHLDRSQTPLLRGVIRRSGRPCGLMFQVEGPRLLKTYAVWVGEENRILCYDSAGLRFAEIQLSESPDPLQLAA